MFPEESFIMERIYLSGRIFRSVSYTHLDVYKRQVQVQAGIFVAQQCPVSQQVGNVCSQYTDIEGFHNIFIRSALQSLEDVYKRQE